jgi:hypothetical protein
VDPGPCRREGSIFLMFFCFVRVSVLLIDAMRRRLSVDVVRSSPSSPPFGDVSSIVGGRVEVSLWWISWDSVGVCLRWIHVDPVFARLCPCVWRLGPSDLCFYSSAAVAVLVRWSYEALARQHPDSLLYQCLPGSDEGGAMTAARLWLVPVLVVVARWSTDLDVSSNSTSVLCTILDS